VTLTAAEMRARLQEALDFGGGLHSIEQLIVEVVRGSMQCFHSENAVVFTQIEARGPTRILNVYLAAGDLDEVLALQPQFMALGRAEGCTRVLMHGRLGWRRILPKHGWAEKYTTWEREL
jgi:hypothetical protein